MSGYLEDFVTVGEAGTALTNSTAATSILPNFRKVTIPTYFFDRVGKRLRIVLSGQISTVVTTPGTLTLDVRFGSVIVFNGGAMTLNTTAKTNVGWILTLDLYSRALGSGTSANVIGQGSWQSEAVIASAAPTAGGASSHILPYNTAPVVGTGFDSTSAQSIDVFGTWSVANASNSIQTLGGYVQSPT